MIASPFLFCPDFQAQKLRHGNIQIPNSPIEYESDEELPPQEDGRRRYSLRTKFWGKGTTQFPSDDPTWSYSMDTVKKAGYSPGSTLHWPPTNQLESSFLYGIKAHLTSDPAFAEWTLDLAPPSGSL